MSDNDSVNGTPAYQEGPPPKKSGCLKWLLVLLLGFTSLFIIAVVVAWMVVPGIIKTKVEDHATAIVGSDVTVEGLSVTLAGNVEIRGFRIASPVGFAQPDFFTFKKVGVSLSLPSLMTDTIVVNKIYMTEPVLDLEVTKDGTQKLKTILDTIQKNMPPATEEEIEEEAEGTAEAGGPAKALILKEFLIEGFAINFLDAYADSDAAPIDGAVQLGKLSIRDVFIPAAGNAAPSIMTIEANEFELLAPEKFSRRDFVRSDSFTMEFDLGSLMASLNDETKTVIIPAIRNKGAGATIESLVKNEDDTTPQNLREFKLMAMNTATLDPPKTFADIDREAREAKAKEKAAADKAAAEGPTLVEQMGTTLDTIVKAQEAPPVVESATPPPPPPVKASVKLIELTEMSFDYILAFDPDKSSNVTNLEVIVEDLIYPHEDGKNATVVVRANPVDAESKASFKVIGELTKTENQTRYLELVADFTNQQIAKQGKVESGRLTATANITLKDMVLDGKISFRIKDFAFKPSDNAAMNFGQATIAKVIQGMDKTGQKLEIPIRIDLRGKSSSKEVAEDMIGGVSQGVASSATGMVTDVMDTAKETAKDAVKEAENLLDGLKSGDVESTEDLEKKAQDLKGKIPGLFGGKK